MGEDRRRLLHNKSNGNSLIPRTLPDPWPCCCVRSIECKMGNSVSGIEIKLDQETGENEILPIAAGSLLKGSAEVKLSSSLTLKGKKNGNDDSPVPSPIQLRFYGKEKVRMNRSKATKQNGGGVAEKTAERQIMDLRLEWPEFPSVNEDGVVEAGTHVFPFAFWLPSTLPSSTYYPMNDNRSRRKLRFRIQYKLTVELDSIKPVSRYLWITAITPNPPPRPLPCMLEPVTHDMQGGFFNSGVFLFGASVDDCRVKKGDFLNLHVACRNDSSATIQRVKVSVLETLYWGTSAINQVDPVTGVASKSATLSQSAANRISVLDNVRMPGLAKERKGMLGSLMETVMGSQHQQLQRQVYDDLIAADSLTRIQVPATSRESYTGQLITVKHCIRIEFETGMFNNSPAVEIPVFVMGAGRPVLQDDPNAAAIATGALDPRHVPSKEKIDALLPANTGMTANDAAAKSSPKRRWMAAKEESEADLIQLPTVTRKRPAKKPESTTVLGGDAITHRDSKSTRALADLVAMSAPEEISLKALLGEMRKSINEYEMLTEKLSSNPDWVTLLSKITPQQFGSIVSCVETEFDQPPIAVLVASHLEGGLTCEFAAAALHSCSSQHRAVMAQSLVPMTVDRKYDLIRAELNEWELMVADGAVQEALAKPSNGKNKRTPVPA